uniref:Superoxide dismutase copper chaperone n=1 Tax=Electrophorus electricus TaxID=8005 RepID=A0A4W4FW07_ELEEL
METNQFANLEFAVQMTCDGCANAVESALQKEPGVRSFKIDLSREEVLVETSLSTHEIQGLIESTGRKAVLKGLGGPEPDLGAAVAMLSGAGRVQGVVRFLQLSQDCCLIDGAIDGLDPGLHGLHVHEYGDLTQDCTRALRSLTEGIHVSLLYLLKDTENVPLQCCGEHYNPFGKQHGGPEDKERHVGDLGNIVAAADGRATFRLEDSQLKVWDVIGRSLVVDSGEDDLGKGDHPLSSKTGNSGERLACGIIARSAGLFQNPKQICACDGVTLWEERDRPLAGKGRRITDTPPSNL